MNKDEITYYMGLAQKEAKKAEKINEVPIGAILIDNKKNIIGRGFNKSEGLSDPTAHAEIRAIRSACRKKKDWRLDNSILFTTIEPCEMCMGLIIEARIKTIYFGSKNYKKLNSEKRISMISTENIECGEIVKSFFKKLR